MKLYSFVSRFLANREKSLELRPYQPNSFVCVNANWYVCCMSSDAYTFLSRHTHILLNYKRLEVLTDFYSMQICLSSCLPACLSACMSVLCVYVCMYIIGWAACLIVIDFL